MRQTGERRLPSPAPGDNLSRRRHASARDEAWEQATGCRDRNAAEGFYPLLQRMPREVAQAVESEWPLAHRRRGPFPIRYDPQSGEQMIEYGAAYIQSPFPGVPAPALLGLVCRQLLDLGQDTAFAEFYWGYASAAQVLRALRSVLALSPEAVEAEAALLALSGGCFE